MITCPCGCTSFYVLEVWPFQGMVRLKCRACESIVVMQTTREELEEIADRLENDEVVE